MWTYEHTADTDLAPEALWPALRDVDNWTAWDTSMEKIELRGPFAVGSRIAMTPKGQDEILSTITAIDENALVADQIDIGDATLAFSHALDRLTGGGTRVRFRLEISGPAADRTGPELGPMITEDFPDAVAALIAYARS